MINKYPEYDHDLRFIKKFFGDQKQKSGSLFLWEHGLQTALYLSETIEAVHEIHDDIKPRLFRAALGHDLLEDTACTDEEILAQWGTDVLTYIKELTNVKGDKDFKAYIKNLKTVDESIFLIKLADIYANVANSVKEFSSLDLEWITSFWLPLLNRYEIELFSRSVNRYRKTIRLCLADIKSQKKKLEELYQTNLRTVEI